jgi:hypothetical protein
MSNIKFYTEEQVKKALNDCGEYFIVNMVLEKMKPIELPSDEEMANASNHCKDGQVKVGFLRGVLWLKEQILNQNKC